MNDPLNPSGALLCKLGSIVVHVQEMQSPDGHPFDQIALAALLDDAQVVAWIEAMASRALLPVKRVG